MIELSTMIAVAGIVLSVATFLIGRLSAAKSEGKEAGTVATDLQYIKKSVERIERQLTDDVKRLEGRIDEQSTQMVALGQAAARAHESAKSAHKRLDEHLEREHGQTIVRRTDK